MLDPKKSKDIRFYALTSGLGFRIPQLLEEKQEFPRSKKTTKKIPYKKYFLDSLFIALMFLLFLFLSLWQNPLSHVTELLHRRILALYGLLWLTLMLFYFFFFKYFKIPSLDLLQCHPESPKVAERRPFQWLEGSQGSND